MNLTSPAVEPSTREATRAAAAICIVAGLLMAFLAAVPLERYPHSGDEYAYLYQARTFLAGRVVNPPAPDPVAFEQVHIISTAKSMVSKYPPGWPLVLAAGEAIHAGFLVNPLLAAITLWFAFRLARRAAGDHTALAFLALLASNAFFLLNGAGFFSHPLAGLALVLGLLALHEHRRAPRLRHAGAAGAALGVILLARPQDAVAVGIGFAATAVPLLHGLPASRRLAHAAVALAGPIVALALFLLYNHATTGDAILFGHLALKPTDRPSWNPLGSVAALVNRVQEYMVLAPVALAAILLVVPRVRTNGGPPHSNGALAVSALIVAFYWIGYALYVQPDAPPRFGPRYVYPAHLLAMFLAAVALARLLRPAALKPAVALIAAVQLVQAGVMVHSARKTIHAATGLERAAAVLEKAIAPDRALVVVEGSAGSVPAMDLIRNDIDYQAPVLFVRRLPEPPLEGRVPYLWDGAGGVPVLRALDARAPVAAVALSGSGSPFVLRDARDGWLVTRESNRASKYFWAFPGSRPPDWAVWGPCGGGDAAIGCPPAPGEAWDHEGHKWFYADYRTFLRVDEPGMHAFRIRAQGRVRLSLGGRTLIDGAADSTSWAPEFRVDLAPGVHRIELAFAATRRPAILELTALGPDGSALEPWRFTVRAPAESTP